MLLCIDGPGESSASLQLCWLINPKLVFPEIDHQFQGSAWHDPLLGMGRDIADLPKPFDEVAERPGRTSIIIAHK